MAGFLRKRGEGWQLIVSGGFDPASGRRIQHTKTVQGTKREATAALAEFVVQCNQGALVNTRANVSDLLDAWLDRARQDLSPSTVRTTQFFTELYIRPTLGKVPLRKLTAARIDRLYGDLRRAGGRGGAPLAPRTVRRVHNIVHAALEQAVRWEWLPSNPAARTSPPKLGPLDIRPPDPEEVGRLLAAAWAEDPDFAMFLRLAAATGARRGELCGLRWRSVDFERGALLISRGVVLGPGGEVVDKDTKTHAARRIALDAATVGLLGEHRERWRARLALCGLPWSAELYVFSYDAGARTPITPERLTKRFRHLADRLDLEHVRLHDLRHYVATRLIAGGVSVRTVSGRLGHAATSTTVNTYTHFVQATDQDAAALLGELLDGTSERRDPDQ